MSDTKYKKLKAAVEVLHDEILKAQDSDSRVTIGGNRYNPFEVSRVTKALLQEIQQIEEGPAC